MRTNIAILSASLLLMGGTVCAQPIVDITMADNGSGQLEIRLRPDGDFNELVSNVVFTLRWQEQFGPALSMIDLVYPQSEYLPVAPSSVVNGGNGYLYRTYSAVAFSPMHDFGHSWTAGMEYPICTLQVLTPGVTPELVNDAFTASNNRNYFVSMNGLSRTGVIYPDAPPVVNAMAVNTGTGYMEVRLMPETAYFGWVNEIDFTVRWPAAGGSLGAIEQDEAIASALPMEKTGPEVTIGGFTYQRFHGTGQHSLAVAGIGWFAQEEAILMRLPVAMGMGEPVVAADSWTATEGADYALLLNGQPRAGTTDDDLNTLVQEEVELISGLTVMPEALRVQLNTGSTGTAQLMVMNACGQLVARSSAWVPGSARIDLSSLAPGPYTLVAATAEGRAARRFIR